MNKILARGGIEFIAVLLGLTLSLWIDENAKENEAISQNDEILSRLYKNLRADSSDGAWNKKAYERGIKGCKRIIEWCDSNPTFESVDDSLEKDLGMGEPFPTTVSVSGALILIYTLFSALVLLDGASGKWTVLHPSMFAFITVTISIFVGLIAGNARNVSDQNQLDAMTGAVVMLLVLISYFRLKREGVEDGITFFGEPVEDEGMWINSLLLFALVMGALFAASEIILPMM